MHLGRIVVHVVVQVVTAELLVAVVRIHEDGPVEDRTLLHLDAPLTQDDAVEAEVGLQLELAAYAARFIPVDDDQCLSVAVVNLDLTLDQHDGQVVVAGVRGIVGAPVIGVARVAHFGPVGQGGRARLDHRRVRRAAVQDELALALGLRLEHDVRSRLQRVPGELAELVEIRADQARVLHHRRIALHVAVTQGELGRVGHNQPGLVGAGILAGPVPVRGDPIGSVHQRAALHVHLATYGDGAIAAAAELEVARRAGRERQAEHPLRPLRARVAPDDPQAQHGLAPVVQSLQHGEVAVAARQRAPAQHQTVAGRECVHRIAHRSPARPDLVQSGFRSVERPR